MLFANAYGKLRQESTIEKCIVPRRELRENDVLVRILFCGVCGTDCHFGYNDWKSTVYPLVPGHEILGRVEQASCSQFKIGDLVAIGCTTESCESCEACLEGEEQFCLERVSAYNGPDSILNCRTYGGYSEWIVVTSRFAIKLPESFPAADLPRLAPLACAGTTIWKALGGEARVRSRVGIAGLGGLGHLALKICVALGHETVVFTSPAKVERAYELGASEVITEECTTRNLSLILDTIPQYHEVQNFISSLDPTGELVMIGYFGKISLDFQNMQKRGVSGSFIGGTRAQKEVLEFCITNNCLPDVEVITPDRINEAWLSLRAGGPPQRFVIEFTEDRDVKLS